MVIVLWNHHQRHIDQPIGGENLYRGPVQEYPQSQLSL